MFSFVHHNSLNLEKKVRIHSHTDVGPEKTFFFCDLINYTVLECIRNMNKTKKIDARYTVAQAIQIKW